MAALGRLTRKLPNGEREQFELSKREVWIGRAATCDIVLNDRAASRLHARLECEAGACVLFDNRSANGTRVNGMRTESARLAPGDVVTIGADSFEFGTSLPPDDFGNETVVETAADLEASIAASPLETKLVETNVPRLAVRTSTRTWEVPLTAEVTTIGRHADNDVVIESRRASRRHARIVRTADRFFVEDLGSENGTWMGPQRIEKRCLEDCDSFRIGSAVFLYKAAFAEEDLTVVEQAAASRAARRPVVVVPGFMGSNLWAGSERIWPNVRGIFADATRFRYDEAAPPFEPRGVATELIVIPGLLKQQHYGRLVDYLEEALGYRRGVDLLEYGYDFRQDVRKSAQLLGAAIENWAAPKPVILVAHSMGCLVSRYYVNCLGGSRTVDRMILLGGPHQGSPRSLAALLPGGGILPFGLTEKFAAVVRTFPSVYQLAPSYECGRDQNGKTVDWLGETGWMPEAQRGLLKGAAAFHAELRRAGQAVPAVCVFGYGIKTIVRADIERGPDAVCSKIQFTLGEAGDATVPESSAVLEGAEIHPVQQNHGTLHTDDDVKKRLKFELSGRQAYQSTTEPSSRS